VKCSENPPLGNVAQGWASNAGLTEGERSAARRNSGKEEVRRVADAFSFSFQLTNNNEPDETLRPRAFFPFVQPDSENTQWTVLE
jgi:hypothetical protein